ncbi:ankyrin repeat-containing protein [Purpureocillium takamizusanense]|uniref:Ankyrin repeat-containing protein n=1 Tax=Purpureocillium takamizusanense TaxID=2060973 RepID=A0A9Q8QF81_9HYPO|nr:ankyrin repeat-containing protein [Purpureocillium takamizusanense]UNI18565.1 ankyrin repeat-containing protein [Purpureocillium takamizusanense]
MAPHLTEDEIDDLIYFARAGENEDMTETLKTLAEREKVTPAEILVAARDEAKSTTLHMATGNGHLEMVRRLLDAFESRPKEEKQSFLDEPNEHGNTGLHWAALGGHLETVKLLMEHGASPALANERNYVPLDLANFNDKPEIVQYFLSFAGMLEESNQESGLNDAAASIELVDGDESKKDGPGSSESTA